MDGLNNRFKIYIDGIGEIGVSSIEGLGVEANYHIYTCSRCNVARQLKCKDICTSTLILRRGVDNSKVMYDWLEANITCPVPRDIAIILFKSSCKKEEVIARWRLYRALPKKYIGPTLNALCEEVAIETLEIIYHGLERVL